MRPLIALLPAILIALHATPRPIVVTGTITAEGGAPIEGASVTVSELSAQSVTDRAGRYVLRLRPVDDGATFTWRARAIGYAPQSRTIAVQATRDTIVADAMMKTDVNALSEIVVTTGGQGARVPFAISAMANPPGVQMRAPGMDPRFNTEEYGTREENPFRSASGNPLSTFSVDVDRAAYSNVRRFIREGGLPPAGAVRIEEMINYFTYGYDDPPGAEPVAIHASLTPAPWKAGHQIVRIGLQAKRIPTASLPPANLVFLIDVSGSMMDPSKLPLVKQGFRLLVDQLREQDRVAIVVYAGNAGLVLPSTSAANKEAILSAIDRLQAGGSTAGGAGIRLAYAVARENYRKQANNRVILATDGDFNVGISSTSELVKLVEEKREDGIFLTVLGFGMGNLKDDRMEQLADKGNGNYAYVDDEAEARKVFVTEFGGTLFTVAKDVKLQVEFNPERVQAWRLIGYENRLLAKEDFADDRKDAGDMGAGHTVTALYEIVPAGAALDVDVGSVKPLRYQRQTPARSGIRPDEILTVSIRYKDPEGDKSRLLQKALTGLAREATADDRFAMAVAGYGMLLTKSAHIAKWDYRDVIELAKAGLGDDRGGLRADFVSMVGTTREIAARVAVPRER